MTNSLSNNRTFDVFVVKKRDGEWEHRAYEVIDGQRIKEPPRTLANEYAGRWDNWLDPIDAIRSAISQLFGDR